jgi:regulator of sigma E protease
MNFLSVLLAILGLGFLMAVHEGGHFLVARAFGMRVVKYSIGFGPVLWSRKPKGSDTTYQIALLPFLAYVQIAGMNPHEPIDADDKKSYANASWIGRFLTIIAGPAANYLLAVVAAFFLLIVAGRPAGADGLKIAAVEEGAPASVAHIQPDDEVEKVAGKDVHDWMQMRTEIQAHKGQEIEIVVKRAGQDVTLEVTPTPQEGKIGIAPKELREKVGVGEAAKIALIGPPQTAFEILRGFGRLLTFKEKPELKGPIGIVQEAQSQIKRSFEGGVEFFALLSIYICVFNLLPFPALDGGRLAFLMYEFIARRRPDAKVEARVHMIGLLALLSLFVPLFFKEIYGLFVKG